MKSGNFFFLVLRYHSLFGEGSMVCHEIWSFQLQICVYYFFFFGVSYPFSSFTPQDIRLLEKEILRGQSFQGPLIAKEIYLYLKERDMLDQ